MVITERTRGLFVFFWALALSFLPISTGREGAHRTCTPWIRATGGWNRALAKHIRERSRCEKSRLELGGRPPAEFGIQGVQLGAMVLPGDVPLPALCRICQAGPPCSTQTVVRGTWYKGTLSEKPCYHQHSFHEPSLRARSHWLRATLAPLLIGCVSRYLTSWNLWFLHQWKELMPTLRAVVKIRGNTIRQWVWKTVGPAQWSLKCVCIKRPIPKLGFWWILLLTTSHPALLFFFFSFKISVSFNGHTKHSY